MLAACLFAGGLARGADADNIRDLAREIETIGHIPAGAVATCAYRPDGEYISGLRSGPETADAPLQCDPAWKNNVTSALASIEKYRNLVRALPIEAKTQPVQSGGGDNQAPLLRKTGEALTCAHLLLGEKTLDDAEAALDAARTPGHPPSPTLEVVRQLKSGAKFSAATAVACKPTGYAASIPDDVWEDMQGKSWHEASGCPARSDLALLHIPFLDFDGRTRFGEMVVAREVAASVLSAFARIYAAGSFPIASIERVDKFGGNDLASMTANNTSAFNCRVVSGSNVLSEHARGLAIDINPLQNPYVGKTFLQPPTGEKFRDRSKRPLGMIATGDTVVEAFAAIGWKWGGARSSSRDYQHFSKSGR